MSDVKTAEKTTYFSIVGNFLLAIAKWIAGYLGNSFALMADAIESTGDIFASILVLIGIKYAQKPKDENHPYGHGKIEPLITFVVVGFLIVSAIIIAFQSIQNIRTPHEAPKPFTLIILGVIIVWKELSYRFVNKKSSETNSTSLKADAWHHRSDAITSLAAFIGIGIAIFMGKGYESADDWAALIASGFILFNAYLIFRPALGEILDENFHHAEEEKIRHFAKEVDGVINVEKCHIRKHGMCYIVDLHMIVDGNMSVKKGHWISHELKDYLMLNMPELEDVLIHIEPDEYNHI